MTPKDSISNRKTKLRTILLRGHRRSDRLGAAVAEFAVVAPVLIMLTMGMMEVGRMVMVKQLMVSASREGARLGTLPGIGEGEVVARVNQELNAVGISGVTINVTPGGLATAAAGTPVTVSLSVPSSQISWVSSPMFSLNSIIDASTTMRRESQ